MKKLVILIAITLMATGLAFAADPQTGAIQTSVTVSGNWALVVSPLAATYGNLKAGESGQIQVLVQTISSNSVNWKLKMKGTTLIRTGGSETISNDNIGAIFFQDNDGTETMQGTNNYTQSANKVLTATDDEVYVSKRTAGPENGSFVSAMLLDLEVPGAAVAGEYRSTVTFTMVEG